MWLPISAETQDQHGELSLLSLSPHPAWTWCTGTGLDTASRALLPWWLSGQAAPTLPEVPGRTFFAK